MKRTIYVTALVIGVAVLAVGGLVLFWPQAPLGSSLSSPTAPPTRLVCYGYVDCRHGPLLLQPARPGRVAQILVREKQTVSADAPLVQLDDHLIKLQEQEAALGVEAAQVQLSKARDGIKQHQAKRAQAEAALEAANSRVRLAQHGLTASEELVQKRFASQIDVDVAQAQLDGARALAKVEQNRLNEVIAVDPEQEVKLAQLQLSRSQAQLERVRQERAEYVLKAPMSGLVLRVHAQKGDLVGPTAPQPAVWLVPQGAWIVRAEVAQEFAGRVREGLEVQVEDEATGAALVKGRIAEVSDCFLPRRQLNPLPTATNTGLTLECVIELQEGPVHLRLGQRIRVRILSATVEQLKESGS